MTAIQKKAEQPDRPPDPRGHRAARRRARRDPPGGPRLARRRRRGVHPQGDRQPALPRARLPRRAAVLAVPARVGRRHRRPRGRQDPREHGDRPQRPARPVGLDARPEDPLDDLGVGQRHPGRAVEALRTTSCTTPTPTSSARTTTSATASCASTRTSPGSPFHLGQPLWNFVNAVLRVRHRGLRPRARRQPGQGHDQDAGVQGERPQGAEEDPQAGHQGLRRPPAAVAARRSSTRWPPTSSPT